MKLKFQIQLYLANFIELAVDYFACDTCFQKREVLQSPERVET